MRALCHWLAHFFGCRCELSTDLKVSVYCALMAASFEEAIMLVVDHDGDSDSTGAITGNILGALHGTSVIPERWLAPMELRPAIDAVASDLLNYRT
jgi:ADP-ribosylglycohydrolase